ncbi:MAG: alpha/beta fold hydrolase, partial [Melioribacteraceae bacterium]|nr:alpha/beta fold hydrolase [Melioribacteraceae bacterium]
MKTIFRSITVIFISLFFSIQSYGQSKLIGDWEGLLNIGSKKIRMLIHINSDGNGYKSKMDSPDQGALSLPLSVTEVKGDSLTISDPKLMIKIAGEYSTNTENVKKQSIEGAKAQSDSIIANFFQNGAKIPINFGRSDTKEYVINRPQTPKPPFPYKSEEVKFANVKAGGIKLAGTLTLPNDTPNPPIAILISGSGAQNRNEKGFEHEPFLILSDYLSRNGIAVLRFDDRGTAESEGNFKSATSFDFSTDAEAALFYLQSRKDVDTKKIGLIGHSEGGMIAPMIAARNSDVAFVVSMAGPAVPLDQLMLKQIEELALSEERPAEDVEKLINLNKEIYNAIKENEDSAKTVTEIESILEKANYANGNLDARKNLIQRSMTVWFRYFIKYIPFPTLEKVKCSFLAINGEKDKQVDAKMNLEMMRSAFSKGKNPDYSVIYLPGLNH